MVTIEEGKYYRTRDGRKLGPYHYSDTGGVWIVGDDHMTARFQDGRCNRNRPLPDDLVTEWVDPDPVPVPSAGPIRMVRQIVPGAYGRLIINGPAYDTISLSFNYRSQRDLACTYSTLNVNEISDLIIILSSIVDVMKENN